MLKNSKESYKKSYKICDINTLSLESLRQFEENIYKINDNVFIDTNVLEPKFLITYKTVFGDISDFINLREYLEGLSNKKIKSNYIKSLSQYIANYNKYFCESYIKNEKICLTNETTALEIIIGGNKFRSFQPSLGECWFHSKSSKKDRYLDLRNELSYFCKNLSDLVITCKKNGRIYSENNILYSEDGKYFYFNYGFLYKDIWKIVREASEKIRIKDEKERDEKLFMTVLFLSLISSVKGKRAKKTAITTFDTHFEKLLLESGEKIIEMINKTNLEINFHVYNFVLKKDTNKETILFNCKDSSIIKNN